MENGDTGSGKLPEQRQDADPESDITGTDAIEPRDQRGNKLPTKPRKKIDKIELSRRVAVVRTSITQGFSRADIQLFAKTQTEWDITERQVDRYIARAVKDLSDSGRRDKELERAKCIARNDLIISRTMTAPKGKSPDYRTAMRANQLNARLLGLDVQRRWLGNDPEHPLPAPTGGGDFIVLVQEVVEG